MRVVASLLLAVSLAGIASADPVAVNPSGSASASGCIRIAQAGQDVAYCGPVAVGGAGDATATPYDDPECGDIEGSNLENKATFCGPSVAATWLGDSHGDVSVSGAGAANGDGYSIAPMGPANGTTAFSVMDDADGGWAHTVFGDADALTVCAPGGPYCVSHAITVFGDATARTACGGETLCSSPAVSVFGDASSTTECSTGSTCQSIAISVFGHASSSGVTLSVCDLASAFGHPEACVNPLP